MNGCKLLQCTYYNEQDNICEDPEEFVDRDTGCAVCRYQPGAEPLLAMKE